MGAARGSGGGPTKDRRSGYQKQLDATSSPFFFTNFPENMLVSEMHKVFGSFGRVGEIYVPLKRDRWNRRFGFVKFVEVSNMELLEASLEEVWWGECKLKVNKARFRREEREEEGRRGCWAWRWGEKLVRCEGGGRGVVPECCCGNSDKVSGTGGSPELVGGEA